MTTKSHLKKINNFCTIHFTPKVKSNFQQSKIIFIKILAKNSSNPTKHHFSLPFFSSKNQIANFIFTLIIGNSIQSHKKITIYYRSLTKHSIGSIKLKFTPNSTFDKYFTISKYILIWKSLPFFEFDIKYTNIKFSHLD